MITGPPYSKVTRSTWGDRKFLGLTERARYLWLYLLTGPHSTVIPGLIPNTGIGTLGDALKWTPKIVRGHFAELSSAGMAIADWDASVIYLPQAIAHNDPPNPNVVLSWRRVPLPQCDLVTRALCGYRLYFATKDNAAFADAFDHAFRKRFPDVFNDEAGTPTVPPSDRSANGRDRNPQHTADQNAGAFLQLTGEPFPEGFHELSPERFRQSLPESRSGSGTGSGKTPLPPVNGGPADSCGNVENQSNTPIRVLRRDRRDADDVRQGLGRCVHTPPCSSYSLCVEKIAIGIALQRDRLRRSIN